MPQASVIKSSNVFTNSI